MKGEFFDGTISCYTEKQMEFYIVFNEEPLLISEEIDEMFWIPAVKDWSKRNLKTYQIYFVGF